MPVGSELTPSEKVELARALGAVTPPSRTPNDTPLITPGTPLASDVDEKPALGKRGIRFADEPEGSSGKRARFASPEPPATTKRARFANPEPTQKRARFAD